MKTQMLHVIEDLQEIPGVGLSIARDLYQLGIRSVADLKDKNPEILYQQCCVQQNTKIDRCLLYVFRCAVYYATHDTREPELLKWWHWKDKEA